jgi:hypothetical protein
MKRNAKITANDRGGHRIEIVVKFTSDNGLRRKEVERVTQTVAREIATRVLPVLPYTNFGAENMKVKA